MNELLEKSYPWQGKFRVRKVTRNNGSEEYYLDRRVDDGPAWQPVHVPDLYKELPGTHLETVIAWAGVLWGDAPASEEVVL